jgi:uncharacterized protein (TIGR03067 family)
MTRFAWVAVVCLALPLCFAGCRRSSAPDPEPEPTPAPTPQPTPAPKPTPTPDPKPPTVDLTKPSDREQLQGVWSVVRLNDRDRELPAEQIDRYRMMLVWHGDSYEWYRQYEVEQQGTFVLDPAASPKRLEKKPVAGDNGPIQKGIYEINGDTLRLSLSATVDYPADFSPDPATMVVEFRRLAKLDDPASPVLGATAPLKVEDLARDMADGKRFARYRDKILVVEGKLLDHSATPGESITLYKQAGPDGKAVLITCLFGFNKRDAVKALPVGRSVRVSGECVDMFGGKLTLRAATILK